MTKNIEGTVDDDIAAKLAIGEGRQVRHSIKIKYVASILPHPFLE